MTLLATNLGSKSHISSFVIVVVVFAVVFVVVGLVVDGGVGTHLIIFSSASLFILSFD